jgi:hypothetical protein
MLENLSAETKASPGSSSPRPRRWREDYTTGRRHTGGPTTTDDMLKRKAVILHMRPGDLSKMYAFYTYVANLCPSQLIWWQLHYN